MDELFIKKVRASASQDREEGNSSNKEIAVLQTW